MVEAWYPGVQAGPALVRVLFGDANFSGRLTVSVPRSVGQEPLYYDALRTGRPAGNLDLTHPPGSPEEKYVSRYLDEENTPLFPFGYGLSYTRFTYAPVKLSSAITAVQALSSGVGTIRVSTTVTNSGTRAGLEVAQFYLSQRGTSVALPVRELEGFKLVALAPGESREVDFTLGRNELAFWNINMQDVVEPAQVTVWIGPNSQEGQSAQFVITK
jgi:beta-glucosidase